VLYSSLQNHIKNIATESKTIAETTAKTKATTRPENEFIKAILSNFTFILPLLNNKPKTKVKRNIERNHHLIVNSPVNPKAPNKLTVLPQRPSFPNKLLSLIITDLKNQTIHPIEDRHVDTRTILKFLGSQPNISPIVLNFTTKTFYNKCKVK